MDAWDYWRLCEELSVDQAAHLIIGMPPGEIEAMAYSGAELFPSSMRRYRTDLEATTTALKNAIRSGRLPAADPNYANQQVAEGEDYTAMSGEPDYENVQILVRDLKKWLFSRGIRTGFFFPDAPDAPDYLDPTHPRYASKLAAAVRAWQAVNDPDGKSPKQALLKWLRENAKDFDLCDDDGKVNESGVEEVAKVANWKPSGGAPKTPSA